MQNHNYVIQKDNHPPKNKNKYLMSKKS